MTREARRGWGKGGGVGGEEGGAAGVPSAQAPRGRGRLGAPHAAAATASSLCVLLPGRLFLGRLGQLGLGAGS